MRLQLRPTSSSPSNRTTSRCVGPHCSSKPLAASSANSILASKCGASSSPCTTSEPFMRRRSLRKSGRRSRMWSLLLPLSTASAPRRLRSKGSRSSPTILHLRSLKPTGPWRRNLFPMAKKRARVAGLGQHIFEAADLAADHPIDTISSNEGRLIPIPLDQIRPNPEQPRQHFSPEELRELAESIKTHGVLQPIVVEEDQNGFVILVGERRWRAAQVVGVSRIPAVVRKPGSDRLALALIENAQREDLNPVEEAEALQKLTARGYTNRQVAQLVNKSESLISEALSLTHLPEDLRAQVRDGLTDLPRKALATIAGLDSHEAM